MIMRDLFARDLESLDNEFCDDAYFHTYRSRIFHIRQINHSQILPLFRDEVPVKHSFTEIKKRERKNICMYVYIYMKIYICTNAKVYIFNQENAIVNYYQRALSFT